MQVPTGNQLYPQLLPGVGKVWEAHLGKPAVLQQTRQWGLSIIYLLFVYSVPACDPREPMQPKATHLQGFHEGFSPRFGNGAQVVDEVCFCHPNASVHQGQCALPGVGDDVNFQVFPTVQL